MITESENTPIISGRTVLTTLSAESSTHSGVSFGSKSRGLSSEGLTNATTASDSASYCPDQLSAALRGGEA